MIAPLNMAKSKNLLLVALAGALALSTEACKASLPDGVGPNGTGGAPGTGGFTGTGGGEPVVYFPLSASATGFVADQVTGVVGFWYAYGDGVGANANPTNGTDAANSDCELKGQFPASTCSQITTPTPGLPAPPSDLATSKFCTSGTAAQVLLKDGAPDYADLWGAGLGFDFNQPLGNGPPGYFDMTPYKGISFDFTADILPIQSMRVNFPFLGMHASDAPYWMGAAMSASPLTGTTENPQHVVIDWADIGGPFYLSLETPPIDAGTYPLVPPRAVQGIQFQVFTNTQEPTPYSFCVANLALVVTPDTR
jgi:hypothetical protein